jgi:hypothetical protein
MTEGMLTDVLVFAGLMALLGTIAKVVPALVHRLRGLPNVDVRTLEEIAARLARLEQVTEATALEVERIGEGQRFTTKLLGERSDTAPH